MFQTYKLDQVAQELVLNALRRDPETLNQAYKMRMTVPYGLERFWGESLRLDGKKAQYWTETWSALVKILEPAGLKLPNERPNDIQGIQDMTQRLWKYPEFTKSFDDQEAQLERIKAQRVTIAVLTELCDCLVWWTQRYKGTTGD